LRHEDNEVEEEYPVEGQEHVYTFYDTLTEDQQRQLDADLEAIRVQEVTDGFNYALEKNNFALQGITMETPFILNWNLKTPPNPQKGANLTILADVPDNKRQSWRHLGLELYHKGKMAIVILSGGLDARLGKGIPKGVLDIGLLSHKSIFQLFCERVRRLQHLVQRKFGGGSVSIPLYILCNSENRKIIEDFFRDNGHFGINEADLLLFTQGNGPLMNKQGKFLFREKHRIALEPHGNGGVFRALVEEGMISDMKSRGVTAMFLCSIDNVLTKVGDPTFVGYCEACKTEAGLKVVEKLLPDETLGVFGCKVYRNTLEDVDGDGKLDDVDKKKAAVVEFFEVPEDVRRRRTKARATTPGLEMNAGNLSQYYCKIDFAKRNHSAVAKRWHSIPRAVAYINIKTGERVPKPQDGSKNAVRLEMFIFDIFESAKSVCGMMVLRDECALVKSHFGLNSMRTAVQAVGSLHQRWIFAAGGKFVEKTLAAEREDFKCEISPLVSYDGEDLFGQFPKPVPLPFYMPSQLELAEFSAGSVKQQTTGSVHFVDMESNLVQQELGMALQIHLGEAVRRIEDKSSVNYTGEQAMQDEVLPATPRKIVIEQREGSSLTSSPRSPHSPHSGDNYNAQVVLADAGADADLLDMDGLPKEMSLVSLEPRRKVAAPKVKPGTKDRFATWGFPGDKVEPTPGSSPASSPRSSPRRSKRSPRKPGTSPRRR